MGHESVTGFTITILVLGEEINISGLLGWTLIKFNNFVKQILNYFGAGFTYLAQTFLFGIPQSNKLDNPNIHY